MFKNHGVVHFNVAISHPSSVGLAERYVRMIIGSVRLQCLQAGSTDFWSHYVRNAVININTFEFEFMASHRRKSSWDSIHPLRSVRNLPRLGSVSLNRFPQASFSEWSRRS
jgi:hypothetical protein